MPNTADTTVQTPGEGKAHRRLYFWSERLATPLPVRAQADAALDLVEFVWATWQEVARHGMV